MFVNECVIVLISQTIGVIPVEKLGVVQVGAMKKVS